MKASIPVPINVSSQIDEGFYKVYFRDVEIGAFDAEAFRFRPVQVMR